MTNRRGKRPAQPQKHSPRGALSEGNAPVPRMASNADDIRDVAPGNFVDSSQSLQAQADAAASTGKAAADAAASTGNARANAVLNVAKAQAAAEQETVSVLASLSQTLGNWADQAAAEEGARAGAIAGNDPNYRPKGASTIRGRAFEKAATQTYLDNLDARMREDIANIADAHTGNPGEMVEAFAGMREVYRKRDVFPEIEGKFDAAFKRATLAPVRSAERAVEGRARDKRVAALENDLAIRLRDLERNAYALGLDASADETLAADLVELRGVLSGTDLNGNPLVSPRERERILRDASATVTRTRVTASYERLETVEAKRKFLDQFDADYTGGAENLAALDARSFRQLRNHMEAGIRHQSGAVREDIKDDLLSVRTTGTGTELNRETVRAVFGDDGLQSWIDDREDASVYFAMTHDMAGLPADAIEARVAALAPEPGEEGYAREAKLYDEVRKEADSVLRFARRTRPRPC